MYDNVARMKTASDAEPKMPDARLAPEEFTRRSDDYLREHALWSSGVVAREKLFGLLQNACLDAVVQAFDQVLSNAADRFDPAAAEYSEYATTLQGASVSSLLDAAGHEDHAELVSAWHGRQRLRAELDAVVAAVRPAFTIRWMDTDGAAMTRLIATDVNSAAVHSSDGWREAGVYPAVLAQGGSLRMARSAAEYGQRRGSDPVVVLDDDDDLPEGVSVGVVEPEAPRGKRIKPVRA
ncbi:hypothetical protein ACIGG9_24865 [Pseudonocardia alni]|uniref:hypothetical protein n=1 Tax=Pseudonocardia alni TaxID=33907 RepID=UPI0033C29686